MSYQYAQYVPYAPPLPAPQPLRPLPLRSDPPLSGAVEKVLRDVLEAASTTTQPYVDLAKLVAELTTAYIQLRNQGE